MPVNPPGARPPLAFRRPCPVCGAGLGLRLGELSFAAFDDSPLGGDFVLAGCPRCGLAFYDSSLLDSATLAAYYARNAYYATAATPGAGGDSEADGRRWQEVIRRLAPWLPEDRAAPLMEAGCGRGGFLAALAGAGYTNLYGVDPLPASAAAARARGFQAEVGEAARLPFPDTRPRLLAYSHVFEHLLEPREALDEARRRLDPEGLVYIEVPDAEHYGVGGGAP